MRPVHADLVNVQTRPTISRKVLPAGSPVPASYDLAEVVNRGGDPNAFTNAIRELLAQNPGLAWTVEGPATSFGPFTRGQRPGRRRPRSRPMETPRERRAATGCTFSGRPVGCLLLPFPATGMPTPPAPTSPAAPDPRSGAAPCPLALPITVASRCLTCPREPCRAPIRAGGDGSPDGSGSPARSRSWSPKGTSFKLPKKSRA